MHYVVPDVFGFALAGCRVPDGCYPDGRLMAFRP